MREQCSICGKRVKDKFLLGFLHLCLTDKEQQGFGTYIAASRAGAGHAWVDAINKERGVK